VDTAIKIWEFETMKQLPTLEGYSGAVNSVEISIGEEYIESVSEDNHVRVWKMEKAWWSPYKRFHTY